MKKTTLKAGDQVRLKTLRSMYPETVNLSLKDNLNLESIYTVESYCKIDNTVILDGYRYLHNPNKFIVVNPKVIGTARISRTSNKQFRFNLRARNGEIVATSETYTQKKSLKKTLENLFPQWEIVDTTRSSKTKIQ